MVDAAAPRMSPLIVLQKERHGGRKMKQVPDEDGWMTMGRRCGRWEKPEHRPRRPVPVDLWGRCFNCFSPSHRAASCRSRTRCFSCRNLGHRSSDCRRQLELSRSEASRPRLQHLVWRPKVSLAGSAPLPAPVNVVSVSGGVQGRKRRRRKKKTDSEQDDEATDGSSPTPDPPSCDAPADVEVVRLRPRRILDRSTFISQQEERLSRALIITVLLGCSSSILDSIADRFEIEVSLMSLQRFVDARYLLILPSSELAERAFNGGRPFIATPLRLHVMRWSRFVGSTVATLHLPVEVDIRGSYPRRS